MNKQDYLASGFTAPLRLRFGANPNGAPCVGTISSNTDSAMPTVEALMDDYRVCAAHYETNKQKGVLTDEDLRDRVEMEARHEWLMRMAPIAQAYLDAIGFEAGEPVPAMTPGKVLENDGYTWVLRNFAMLEAAGCDPAFVIAEQIRSWQAKTARYKQANDNNRATADKWHRLADEKDDQIRKLKDTVARQNKEIRKLRDANKDLDEALSAVLGPSRKGGKRDAVSA